MNLIFVIGPVWTNLDVLLDTIDKNRKMLSNIKKIYIPTNHKDVEKYFIENPNENILCKFFKENQGHQLSCYNSVIAGMHMVLENEKTNDNDIVIFSHEDCYVKNIDLFNNAINKIKNENYEIVCREFDAPKCFNHYDRYYMFDSFFIKKSVISKYFKDVKLLDKFYHFGDIPKDIFKYHCKDKKFGEGHFTKIIENGKIYSILYSAFPVNRNILTPIGRILETHGTWKNTELGFYHIPGRTS
jgi:hypothetical protein|tara:strand:- start:2639 stop:3367 length:729 start_codon:yes stop_codon:yes gene_type:complete